MGPDAEVDSAATRGTVGRSSETAETVNLRRAARTSAAILTRKLLVSPVTGQEPTVPAFDA